MKKLFILICILFSSVLIANDVTVSVEPKNPVLNDNFYVTFKIRTTDSEEPYISFTPYGASVVGKRSQGLSISTVVINGKFTTTKEQAVVYELSADRVGQVYLRDVQVELSGKTIPVEEVRITVVKEPLRTPEAFIETEASKTKVYLGEGLNVNYYLYFKNSITANDVKEFPKLNKFIKRFHHVNAPVETVQYQGQVLRRILVYSARIYGEKTGNAVLDPMKLGAQIIETSRNGGFGFSTQRYKNVDLASERVDIEILPLPAENVPAGFTGLVGTHEYKIIVPKTKYLVNEPIELKLEVTGDGALENLDAPVLYQDNNLEQFDTNSEIKEIGLDSAKKTFEYTLLARGPLKIPERKMEIAFFDSQTHQYVTKTLVIPAIEVGGAAQMPANSNNSQIENKKNNEKGVLEKVFSRNDIGMMGPMFKTQDDIFSNGLRILNWILLFVVLGLGIETWRNYKKNKELRDSKAMIKGMIRTMKSKGIDYSKLYKILSALDKKNSMALGGISLIDVVKQSSMSAGAKDYFIEALNALEGNSFKENKSGVNAVTFQEKYFKEIIENL